MKRASKRNPRQVTRRALKLESLERREVFAVGGLDPSFAYGLGKTVADFGGTVDYSMDSAFQADGKIVVVGGTTAGGGDSNFALARYNSDGSLDASFGGFGGIGVGRVATDFASGSDQAFRVLIQPDGKILVVGHTNPFGIEYGESEYSPNQPVEESRWAIARYNADGSPDNTFGVLGKVTINRPGIQDNVEPLGMFIQGDKLLLVGWELSETTDLLLTRVNLSDGALDVSFGNSGHVLANTPITARAAALHGDGIVLAGRADTGEMGFARIHMDGSLDMAFGINGLAVIGPEYEVATLNSVVVQSDGAIVGAGGGPSQLLIVRVLPNGMADASFNVDGVVDWPQAALPPRNEVALGPNGSIIAVGRSEGDFAIVRVGSDGVPDQNFGVGGLVKVDFGNSEDSASSVLTYANGKILVTGTASSNFAIARINGAAVLGNPGGPTRPGGLAADLPNLPPTHALFRPGFLLTLVERIDQAIAQHRADHPTSQPIQPSRSSVPASRNNGSTCTNQSSLLDDFFAELGNETQKRGGSNSNIANHPHQLSLRVSGSH